MTNPYEKSRTLSARLIRSEVLSPESFLEIKTKSPNEIASSRPVGPELGQKGFGGIEVTYKTPRYQVA